MTGRSMIERESDALFHTYDRLAIGSVKYAEGCMIHTEKGEYLDLISGLGVNALGYSHPGVVEAISDQAQRYLHLSNLYLQEPQVVLAEQVKRLSGYDKVFFCNSGTEAVEGAIKLARKCGAAAGKFEVFGLENAFHGRTYGALSLMDKLKYREGFTPLVEGIRCTTPESLETVVSEKTAAVILEVIQGEGGIKMVAPETVALLKRLQERYGLLVIADEIQSGIGRTGTFFAFEQIGLKPDIIVAAKAIGGGLPLGAIIANDRVASAFTPGVHGTTFGGNALSCVAGSVVMEEVENGLMKRVSDLSSWLFDQLNALKTKHSEWITEIRGAGLMIGIQCSRDPKPIQSALLDRGFITNVTGTNVIRLLPPLVISRGELERFLEAFDSILGA